MIDHGDILYNMIFIGGFDPLQIGEDGEGEMVDAETAGFVDVEEVGVLGLFLLLHGEVGGVVGRGVDGFGGDHEVVVVLLGQEGVENGIGGED